MFYRDQESNCLRGSEEEGGESEGRVEISEKGTGEQDILGDDGGEKELPTGISEEKEEIGSIATEKSVLRQ